MTFWYDPMVNTVGMPNNPGPGGNNLAATQAMNAQLTAQRNYAAQNQMTQGDLYGPGGYGYSTAQAAALGAAYGRNTGGFGGAPGRVGTIGNPGTSNPNYNPGGGGAIPGGSRSMNLRRMGMGGIGSDAARAPDDTPWGAPPQIEPPVDHPYPLGDSSWYPSQRSQPAAPDYSSWYAGLPGGAQAYNSWNLGLPAQGGFGVPGAGGGAIPGGSRSMNAQRMGGDIGFTPQSPMPNLGYNPGMQNLFANPGMNANQFQNRFGMGFPNAGTPSQYAPGAQLPPGFRSPYSVDNPQGALPLGWSNSFNN